MHLWKGDQNEPQTQVTCSEHKGHNSNEAQFDDWPKVPARRSLLDVTKQRPRKNKQSLERVEDVANDVVMVASKPVRSSFIFWSVFVAMVVANVRGKEHEGRGGLKDT